MGSTTGNEILFQDALRRGYRISPAGDQDNHQANWGASTETRTVVQAAGLTKSEILGALALGTVIGLERQWRQHPAGLRTNALVAIGAALFVSLSRLVPGDASPTRVAAYVVSGVGFLGGGVILKEGANVRGITTAATLWCSAAVGTLTGMGFGLHAAVGVDGVEEVSAPALRAHLTPPPGWCRGSSSCPPRRGQRRAS